MLGLQANQRFAVILKGNVIELLNRNLQLWTGLWFAKRCKKRIATLINIAGSLASGSG